MLLSQYLTATRDLVLDPNANFFSTTQLTNWINQGRSKAALKAQCVRIMPAPTGYVVSYTITSPGAGYSTATAVVTAPDAVDGTPTQATATVQLNAGQVIGLTVVVPGSGYIATPTVEITGDGVGATAIVNLSPHLTTIPGQEIYSFADINSIISQTYAGAGNVIGIQSAAVSWGNMRPTLQHWDFSSMQAYLRAGSIGMQNFPQAWAQYGQGSLGSIYFWPVPAQAAQLELDCYCDVLPLSASQTVDLIPDQFSDAVPWWAAYVAMTNAQRFADAAQHLQTFEARLMEARVGASPAMIPTMYPGL